MTLSKTKVVVRARPRLLRAAALTRCQSSFSWRACTAVNGHDRRKREAWVEENKWTFTAIEAGIVIGIAIPDLCDRRLRG